LMPAPSSPPGKTVLTNTVNIRNIPYTAAK
jgi:hypothetical protein